jgi:hypothetical protein
LRPDSNGRKHSEEDEMPAGQLGRTMLLWVEMKEAHFAQS